MSAEPKASSSESTESSCDTIEQDLNTNAAKKATDSNKKQSKKPGTKKKKLKSAEGGESKKTLKSGDPVKKKQKKKKTEEKGDSGKETTESEPEQSEGKKGKVKKKKGAKKKDTKDATKKPKSKKPVPKPTKKGEGKKKKQGATGKTKTKVQKDVDLDLSESEKKPTYEERSVSSQKSEGSTGGVVVRNLGFTGRPPSFYMNEGSIESAQASAAMRGQRHQNLTHSSSATSQLEADVARANPRGGKTRRDAESRQMEEIANLHRRMLEMQTRNYNLTRSVANAGAETAEAVKHLLATGSIGTGYPGGRGPPSGEGFFTYDNMPPGRKMLEPKTVHIRVVFLRVIDIDTVSQQFEAEVYIEARWTEKKFHGTSLAGLANIEFSQCWDPHLKLINVLGDLDMEKTSMVLRYEPEFVSPVLVYMWHVRGIFRERMELQHFPFDVQELSVVVSSDLPVDYVELLEEPMFDSSVNLGALQDNDEWTNYRHVEFVRDVTTQEMESTSKHPVLVVSAHVKRKLGSYFWNVAIIVFLILALTFTLLAVDPTLNDRLSIIMTLFLTAVAFKLVVRSSLPNISYLTYLDMYVIFSLAYLFLQGAESAMMIHLSRFRDPAHVREYDEIAQSCLIAFLIFFHLVFIIYIELTVLNRRRRMVTLDHDFKLNRLKRKKARMERQEAMEASDAAYATTV